MAPRLPQELYQEILENLHPRDDIETLLSTSLASRTLKDESQRILFCAGPLSLQEHQACKTKVTNETITKAYTVFLEAILGRTNLARYVHRYSHLDCILNDSEETGKLIDLVTRALPRMKNLKVLAIDICDFNDTNHVEAFCYCKFRLHSLKLVVGYQSPVLLYKFLHHQQAFAHLDIYDDLWTMADIAPSLVEGVLPALTSLQTNNIDFWTILEPARSITALCLCLRSSGSLTEAHMSTLINVKYLRLVDARARHLAYATTALSSTLDLKAEVLDIDDGMFLVTRSAKVTDRLPYLRILIQRGYEDADLPQSTIRFVAATAFRRFPRLLYFIMPNKSSSKGAFLYRRKSGSDISKDDACSLEEHDFEFDRYGDEPPNVEWWMGWADILSDEKMLGIPS